MAVFAFFQMALAAALRRTRWAGQIAHLAALQSVTRQVHESGASYVKLPFITTSPGNDPGNDPCPLLRAILTDGLRCGVITEITGGGNFWWDFTYKGKRFTCKLLPKSAHGSELCFTNRGISSEDDYRLLQQLVYKIAWQAATKTGLDCHSVVCSENGE
jgi:hypothetical protein